MTDNDGPPGTSGDGSSSGVDDRLLGVLSWVLETETRARIYIYLRGAPRSTSDEIADGTGLYPSTVREAAASLHGDGYLTRQKRTASGAGNNPYEYDAIPPTELVDRAAGRVQSGLNSVVALDERIGRVEPRAEVSDPDADPVEVTVRTDADEGDPPTTRD